MLRLARSAVGALETSAGRRVVVTQTFCSEGGLAQSYLCLRQTVELSQPRRVLQHMHLFPVSFQVSDRHILVSVDAFRL